MRIEHAVKFETTDRSNGAIRTLAGRSLEHLQLTDRGLHREEKRVRKVSESLADAAGNYGLDNEI